MLGFLKKILDVQVRKPPEELCLECVICEKGDTPPKNKWYRLSHWKNPTLAIMDTTYSKDWKTFEREVYIAGLARDDRKEKLAGLVGKSDLKVMLEREPDNPVNPNAIKVIISATVDGNINNEHIGYVPKKIAASLKDEPELDARPRLLKGSKNGLIFNYNILVRSARYKKKKK